MQIKQLMRNNVFHFFLHSGLTDYKPVILLNKKNEKREGKKTQPNKKASILIIQPYNKILNP